MRCRQCRYVVDTTLGCGERLVVNYIGLCTYDWQFCCVLVHKFESSKGLIRAETNRLTRTKECYEPCGVCDSCCTVNNRVAVQQTSGCHWHLTVLPGFLCYKLCTSTKWLTSGCHWHLSVLPGFLYYKLCTSTKWLTQQHVCVGCGDGYAARVWSHTTRRWEGVWLWWFAVWRVLSKGLSDGCFFVFTSVLHWSHYCCHMFVRVLLRLVSTIHWRIFTKMKNRVAV